MKTLLTTITFLLVFVSAIAQTSTITGKIYDDYSNPLSGINVYVQGTKNGTTTDESGSFELKNILTGKTIVISSIGFKSQEFVVNGTQDLGTITLYEGNEVLQEVIIEADRKNKFSRKETAYVGKMPLKDLENSQVYNTVTNQLIESQSVITLDEALNNTAGITKLWNATGRSNDGAAYFTSRGFAVQPQLVNGIAGFTNGLINSANIERIETIKGPSGTLFGSAVAGYGGLINIVTKKPYKGTGGSVSVNYGSNNFKRVNLDINVTDERTERFSVRFNAGYQDEDSFQDAGFKQSWFMAPSISYEVSKNFTFNLSYETNVTTQTNPTSLFFNRYFPLYFDDLEALNYNPELSFTDNSISILNPNQNYRGEFVWEISNNWTSQSIIGGSDAKSDGFYTYLWNVADWTNGVSTPNFQVYAQKLDSQTKSFNAQQNFTGTFKLGNINNKLLVGADYISKRILDNSSPWVYSNTYSIDGELPFGVFGETGVSAGKLNGLTNPSVAGEYNNSEIHQNIYGAYVSNVFEVLPQLSISAGVRFDMFDYQGDVNTDDDNDEEYFKRTLSPKFGVVYQPILDKVSVFANYQNGFTYKDPEADLITGELISFDVIKANQLEFGVKGNLFNNKLEGTLSFYNIDVDNMYSYTTNTQDQKVNSKGVELEVNANPIDGLNIHGGFSHNISEIKDFESYPDFEGLRYHESGPATTYNLWADYKFTNGAIKNFGLGAGFNGASEQDTMVGYQPITGSFMLPAYTILNASVYYENDKFRVSVKGNNLSDVDYYTGWSTITPEQPRTFLGSFTYKF